MGSLTFRKTIECNIQLNNDGAIINFTVKNAVESFNLKVKADNDGTKINGTMKISE